MRSISAFLFTTVFSSPHHFSFLISFYTARLSFIYQHMSSSNAYVNLPFSTFIFTWLNIRYMQWYAWVCSYFHSRSNCVHFFPTLYVSGSLQLVMAGWLNQRSSQSSKLGLPLIFLKSQFSNIFQHNTLSMRSEIFVLLITISATSKLCLAYGSRSINVYWMDTSEPILLF